MKSSWALSLGRSRCWVAIGAGGLLAAAFPRPGVAGFAWVAPGLMLAAALGQPGASAFRLGYLAGLTHYLAMLYWLLLIPYRWHGLPLGPATGWLVLSAVLALCPAFWVWLMAPTMKVGANPEPETQTPTSDWVRAISSLPRRWPGRLVWALSGAAVWVAVEMVLARVLGGFPWDLLGVSQYRMTPLIQIASITGVYGVSFLVTWLSLSLLSATAMVVRRPTSRSVWVAEVCLPLLTVAVLFNLGLRRLWHEPPTDRSLRVTLVQPSIPQTLIWNQAKDDERFQDLLKLTGEALTNQTDLLLWPEAASPKMLRWDTNTLDMVTALARRHHVWMIIGSDDAEPHPAAGDPDAADYFNTSFLISPNGELVARYVKRNLVMFGEYVPFERWLPFMRLFTPIGGGFVAGSRATPFDLASLGVHTSVLICFEDVFPQLACRDAGPDTDFLVNLTNDGWFDESAAQWQHAATALFRAVENGLPLLRCCNNGVSCWVDAQGRMRDVLRDASGTVYGRGFMQVAIPLRDPRGPRELTFYGRHGDWFGWACVAVAVVALLRRVRKLSLRR